MNDLISLISLIAKFGWLPVVLAVGVYILLHGEFNFRYPRK
jgi:hypothetical protein